VFCWGKEGKGLAGEVLFFLQSSMHQKSSSAAKKGTHEHDNEKPSI